MDQGLSALRSNQGDLPDSISITVQPAVGTHKCGSVLLSHKCGVSSGCEAGADQPLRCRKRMCAFLSSLLQHPCQGCAPPALAPQYPHLGFKRQCTSFLKAH